MNNNYLIRRFIIALIGLTLFTIIMMVLVGPNGIINQEKQKYNETHSEEVVERQNNNENKKN